MTFQTLAVVALGPAIESPDLASPPWIERERDGGGWEGKEDRASGVEGF